MSPESSARLLLTASLIYIATGRFLPWKGSYFNGTFLFIFNIIRISSLIIILFKKLLKEFKQFLKDLTNKLYLKHYNLQSLN